MVSPINGLVDFFPRLMKRYATFQIESAQRALSNALIGSRRA